MIVLNFGLDLVYCIIAFGFLSNLPANERATSIIYLTSAMAKIGAFRSKSDSAYAI
jgi:hypothetical protein